MESDEFASMRMVTSEQRLLESIASNDTKIENGLEKEDGARPRPWIPPCGYQLFFL